MEWRSRHIKKTNAIVALVLCLAFTFLVINKAVYYHAHIKADGTIVNHTHPYNKHSDSAPFKKHHHSNAEYAFLKLIKLLFTGVIALISVFLSSKKLSLNEHQILNYISVYSPDSPGRSPPQNFFQSRLQTVINSN